MRSRETYCLVRNRPYYFTFYFEKSFSTRCLTDDILLELWFCVPRVLQHKNKN